MTSPNQPLPEHIASLISTMTGVLQPTLSEDDLLEKFKAFGELSAELSVSADETLVQTCKTLLYSLVGAPYTVDHIQRLSAEFQSFQEETSTFEAFSKDSGTSAESSQTFLPILRVSLKDVIETRVDTHLWSLDTPLELDSYLVTGGKMFYFVPNDELLLRYPSLSKTTCAVLISLEIIDSNSQARLRTLKRFSQQSLRKVYKKLLEVSGPFYLKY